VNARLLFGSTSRLFALAPDRYFRSTSSRRRHPGTCHTVSPPSKDRRVEQLFASRRVLYVAKHCAVQRQRTLGVQAGTLLAIRKLAGDAEGIGGTFPSRLQCQRTRRDCGREDQTRSGRVSRSQATYASAPQWSLHLFGRSAYQGTRAAKATPRASVRFAFGAAGFQKSSGSPGSQSGSIIVLGHAGRKAAAVVCRT